MCTSAWAITSVIGGSAGVLKSPPCSENTVFLTFVHKLLNLQSLFPLNVGCVCCTCRVVSAEKLEGRK